MEEDQGIARSLSRIPLINQLPDFIVVYKLSVIGGCQALLHFAQEPFIVVGGMNQRVIFPAPGCEIQRL